MKKITKLILICVLLSVRSTVFAYSSVTVPLGDPVYRQLDQLAAHGLIKTMMIGQRPYVRSEIGRLVAEAMKNYPDFAQHFHQPRGMDTEKSGKRLRTKVFVDKILEDLKNRFREELIQQGVIEGKIPTFAGKPLDSIQGEYLYLDEPKITVLPNNGLGRVSASLQPLVENREGRHYQSGSNWSFETHHWARLGKYFSLQVQPRFQFQVAKSPLHDQNDVYVQRLNGRFTLGKFDIEIGRDSVNWGPTPRGGLLFSPNARPLDMIKISSISPFHYPFFFKKLGINEMSLVIANLGPEQLFPYSWLVTYKISNRKSEYLEFGFTQSLILGGDGAPPIGFGSVLSEFFNIASNNTRSYRNFGIELIGRVPKWRGLELYGEIEFSDLSSDFSTMFGDYASYLAGAYLPRLTDSGKLDARLEYRRLSPRYSRSPLFQSGYTENTNILGDPFGPDNWQIFFQSYYQMNPKNLFFFDFEYAHQNNALYVYEGDEIHSFGNLGSRHFYRYEAGMRHIFSPHFEGKLGFGLQHVQSKGKINEENRLNWAVETGFVWHFDGILYSSTRH